MKFKYFVAELARSPYKNYCYPLCISYIIVYNLSFQGIYVILCLYYGWIYGKEEYFFHFWLIGNAGILLLPFFFFAVGFFLPERMKFSWMISWHFIQWISFLFLIGLGGLILNLNQVFILWFWCLGVAVFISASIPNVVIWMTIHQAPTLTWEEFEKKYFRHCSQE